MSDTKNTTPFSQQLAYINKGTLDAELTEALAEVIKAVRETGKRRCYANAELFHAEYARRKHHEGDAKSLSHHSRTGPR